MSAEERIKDLELQVTSMELALRLAARRYSVLASACMTHDGTPRAPSLEIVRAAQVVVSSPVEYEVPKEEMK